MKNLEIVRIFFEIAELLEIKGVQSKAIKYRQAAQFIQNLSVSIEEICHDGNLEDLIEFDPNMAIKIREIVETGKLEYHDKLKSKFPDDLFRLASILGLGFPKTKILYEQFGFERLDDLEKAALEHRISNLEGFGEKLEQQILDIVVKEKKKKINTLFLPLYTLFLTVL